MARLGFPKIAVSVPRVLMTTVLVAGIIVAGVKYIVLASPSVPAYSQTAPAAKPAVTSMPKQSGSATQPVTVPAPAPPAPMPVAVTNIPHSTTPAPVVTPSGSASVSGLTPVDPTPAPASSDTTGDTGGSSTGNSSGTPAPTPPPLTTTSYLSTNWAGYLAADPHTSYTGVSGTWTVPAASAASGQTSYDAAWIGIGGVTSADLIQTGTIDTVSHGHETSFAFYELLPQSATTVTSLTVTPGDSMTASITRNTSGQWSITITDTTTGKSFTTTVSYNSSLSSAEWIEEDPSSGSGNLLPFDTFTPVSFTRATTAVSGSSITAAGSDAQPITLVSRNTRQSLATPSALGTDGQSFTVTRSP